ncbi:MAG: hypothetical protein FJW85_13345 [Actinobacteria bacterium]|nr:hypothetical protein [Actinomycetota bacterium]
MRYFGTIGPRIVPLLAVSIVVGCATDHGAAPAPAGPQLLPFTYAPRQDGAVNCGVRAILQDRSGDYWFGSHFDGASFTVIDGARMGLCEGEGMPHVRCVFEDSRGRLWIGNNGVGVVVVEGDSTAGLAPLAGTGDAFARMGAPLTASDAVNRDGVLWPSGTGVFGITGTRFERVH